MTRKSEKESFARFMKVITSYDEITPNDLIGLPEGTTLHLVVLDDKKVVSGKVSFMTFKNDSVFLRLNDQLVTFDFKLEGGIPSLGTHSFAKLFLIEADARRYSQLLSKELTINHADKHGSVGVEYVYTAQQSNYDSLWKSIMQLGYKFS